VGGTQNVSFLGRRYFKLPILSCPRIPPATQAKIYDTIGPVEQKEELSGLFFVLFNLEILVQFNFGQNTRTSSTPTAGHLTVVSACSGGHLTNYFFKSQIPRGLPGGGGLIAVGFDSYITA
jgi:hypothetical protein